MVYLRTTLERLTDMGLRVVLTDRNAATAVVQFACDREDWEAEGFIDWPLMKARMWTDDDQHPDRKERRMAECLAHRAVPWDAFVDVITYDNGLADEVRAIVANAQYKPNVLVRRDWYF